REPAAPAVVLQPPRPSRGETPGRRRGPPGAGPRAVRGREAALVGHRRRAQPELREVPGQCRPRHPDHGTRTGLVSTVLDRESTASPRQRAAVLSVTLGSIILVTNEFLPVALLTP